MSALISIPVASTRSATEEYDQLASSPATTSASSAAVKQRPVPSFQPQHNTNPNKLVWSNWAKTQSMAPSYFHQPYTEEQIKQVLKFAKDRGEKVRVVGSGHSPADICVTKDHALSLVNFNQLLSVDLTNKLVTVQAGMQLLDVNSILKRVGLALPVLGSVSDQTIGGVLGCGTHGSGFGKHIIAYYIAQLVILDADGQEFICNQQQNQELFMAARVNLGCLGVVTRITIRCEDAYRLKETSYALSYDDFIRPCLPSENKDEKSRQLAIQQYLEIIQQGDFSRFWWLPHTDSVLMTRIEGAGLEKKTKQQELLTKEHTAYPKLPPVLPKPTTPLLSLDTLRSLESRAVDFHLLQFLYYCSLTVPSLAPWINRVYAHCRFPTIIPKKEVLSKESKQHPTPASAIIRQGSCDEILNFDCLFQQNVAEYSIPFRHTLSALHDIRLMIAKRGYNVHLPIEVRFVKRDQIWLSQSYSADEDQKTHPNYFSEIWTYIGIIMYRPYGVDASYFKQYFADYEQIMKSYGGRPHFAKDFSLTAQEMRQRFPKYDDFAALRQRMDPTRMFTNQYIDRIFPLQKEEANDKKNITPIKAVL